MADLSEFHFVIPTKTDPPPKTVVLIFSLIPAAPKWILQEDISKILGMAKATICYHLIQLEKIGYIVRQLTGRKKACQRGESYAETHPTDPTDF